MKEVVVNGVSTFKPTYKLIFGEPGTSHAFEIAESLGLDADVIGEARDFIRDEGGRIESLITELKYKTAALDNRIRETEEMKQETERLRSQLKEEFLRLRLKEKEIMAKAMKEAEDVVRKTRREARDIIEALKRASLADAREAAKELDRKLEEVVISGKQYAQEKIVHLKDIKEGQNAFINTLGKHGVVHSVNEKSRRCKVIVDGKELEVPFGDLSEPSADFAGKRKESPKGERPFAPVSENINLMGELNVIGQRVDPALSVIERYLNDASMSGLQQVKIIHGIGAGILAGAIREYLRDHPLVESFRKGSEDEGGEAVTVVLL
jgi:DNA mismatch repair protein MutS2